MLNPTTTTQASLNLRHDALPSLKGGEALLSAVQSSTCVRRATWKGHVNHALMAGARPENAGSSDLAERCFDTFVDQLWEVLLEEKRLPVTQPLQRFMELNLGFSAARRVVLEALARTAQAYELGVARSHAA